MAKISAIIIAIIMGIMCLMLTTFFWSDTMSNYNETANTSFMKVYNETWGSTLGLGSQMANQTQESEINEADVFMTMSSGAYKALKLALAIPALTHAMLVDVANTLHVPPFVVEGLVVVITIVVIFAIISAIFRFPL